MYRVGLITVLAYLLLTELPLAKANKDKCQLKPVDMVFVLDSSNSIWGPDWDTMVAFIRHLVAGFNIAPDKTRVGLMIFTDYPSVVWTLQEKTTRAELLKAFGNVSQQLGNTNSAGALRFMRQRMFSESWGSRSGVAKVCFFLTDGRSDFTKATLKEALLVHALTSVQMFAIGIGQEVDLDELKAVASKPPSGNPLDKNWYFLEDVQQLDNQLKMELSVKACEVEASRTTERLQVTESSLVPSDGTGTWSVCSRQRPADVMFVFDPYSLGHQNVRKAVSLFKDVVNRLPVGKDKYRVGFIPENACVNAEMWKKSANSTASPVSAVSLRDAEGGLFGIIDSLGLRRQQLAAYVEIVRKQQFRGVPSRDGKSRRKIAVVIVDENQDVGRVAFEARKLLIQGADVIAVGIGPGVSRKDLQAVASDERLAYHVWNFGTEALNAMQGDVLRGICAVHTKTKRK